MPREIKFRAWDEEKKIMVYGVERAYDAQGTAFDSNGKELDWYDDTSFWRYNSFGQFIENNVPLMQFTGLKDKNEKEIYEGDVVINSMGSEVIRWREGGFHFEQCDADIHEVIGNIYENPDLLKAQQDGGE